MCEKRSWRNVGVPQVIHSPNPLSLFSHTLSHEEGAPIIFVAKSEDCFSQMTVPHSTACKFTELESGCELTEADAQCA